MKNIIIIVVVIVLILIAGALYFRKSPIQASTPQTELVSKMSLDNTLKAVSSTVEGFEDENTNLLDSMVYQRENVQELVKNAIVAMNSLIVPEKQKICFKTPVNIAQLVSNINSIINQVFSSDIDPFNKTYISSITTLMIIRLTLIGISMNKKNYLRITTDSAGSVVSIGVLPGLQRHIVSVVDDVLDHYDDLPSYMKAYVDQNRERLEAQFGFSQEEVKPKKGKKSSRESKEMAKQKIQSSFSRTIPIETFMVVMMMLASRVEKVDCARIASSSS